MDAETILYQERIVDLEKKLFHSITELNECKKENEEFIHIASHDLQAPLRKLSTFVERLSSRSKVVLEDDTLKYIEKINTTLADMRSLIDDLSALSNVADVNQELVQCDLNKILNEVLQQLTTSINENNVQINSSPLPIIQAHPGQLKEVFTNIISNAIKFRNKNIISQININAEALGDKEKAILNLPVDKILNKIEFTDNGIGFKQEYADKILKPFQRLHGKAAYPGNGLGLAICKKIIEKHQGIIYAKGTENEGAQFVLILPQMHTP